MNGMFIALVTFVCLSAAFVLAVVLFPVLPERYRNPQTDTAVRLGVGMIVTLASLVLGLLTYSVKAGFDKTQADTGQYASELILFDHCMREYGGDAAKQARDVLRGYTADAIAQTWPEESGRPVTWIPTESVLLGQRLERIESMLRRLDPSDQMHRQLASDCLDIFKELMQRRRTWLDADQATLSPTLLVVLIFWLTVIFASFGLNAPRNGFVYATFLLCALSVSASLFLIVEMDTHWNGIIKVSSAPMRRALARESAP